MLAELEMCTSNKLSGATNQLQTDFTRSSGETELA
jgi:hypothetical protein